MNRPSPDTIELAAVDRWLLEANALLRNADVACTDRGIRDAIRRARKELEPAVSRARHILDDAKLRGATQQELPNMEGTEPKEPEAE